jgi:hypothetical protein
MSRLPPIDPSELTDVMLVVLPLLGRYLFADDWRLGLSIVIEGSTREDLDENGEAIEVSTVACVHSTGWFTSCCPILAAIQGQLDQEVDEAVVWSCDRARSKCLSN